MMQLKLPAERELDGYHVLVPSGVTIHGIKKYQMENITVLH